MNSRYIRVTKILKANINITNQEYVDDREHIIDILYDNLFSLFTKLIKDVPMSERGDYVIFDFKTLESTSIKLNNTMDMTISAKVGVSEW